MMKRIAFVCMVLVLALGGLSAEILDFNLGFSTLFNVNADAYEEDDENALLDLANYNFGLDARLKVMILEATALALYNKQPAEDLAVGDIHDYYETSLLLTAGLAFDFMDTVRLGFGLGPRVRSLHKDGDSYTLRDGFLDPDGDLWQDAPWSYRLTVDLLLKPVAFSVSYVLDTDYTLHENDWGDLFSTNWDSGKFGASVLLNW